MITIKNIKDLTCSCSAAYSTKRIAYVLYPMDLLNDWIEEAAKKYKVTIVVITGMDWQNVFSPWAAAGVPAGSPDFKGESPEFLKLLTSTVIPPIEKSLMMSTDVERTLIGVSMSGLFTLWQWMICNTFQNIASLSGSFWYEGFVNWMQSISIPHKTGKAFFLLGFQESKTDVKAFQSVANDTDIIVSLLQKNGIDTEFKSVPGNHYSDPIPRINAACNALFS